MNAELSKHCIRKKVQCRLVPLEQNVRYYVPLVETKHHLPTTRQLRGGKKESKQTDSVRSIACSSMAILHAVLALDPCGDVGSPSQGSSKAAHNVVPLDPFTSRDGTGFLLQQTGLEARVGARAQKDQR